MNFFKHTVSGTICITLLLRITIRVLLVTLTFKKFLVNIIYPVWNLKIKLKKDESPWDIVRKNLLKLLVFQEALAVNGRADWQSRAFKILHAWL